MLFKARLTATALVTTVALSAAAWSSNAAACSIDPYIGSLCIFAGNFEIRSFAYTNGQLLPIAQNTALFSILGTTYGGNGINNFALPDTRGRAIIGPGQGPGLSNYQLGETGGTETVTLTQAQMPAHTHSATTTLNVTAKARGQSAAGTADGPGSNTWAAKPRAGQYSSATPNVDMHADAVQVSASANTSVGVAGSSQPVDIRQPYVAINYLIALTGIYPSRN